MYSYSNTTCTLCNFIHDIFFVFFICEMYNTDINQEIVWHHNIDVSVLTKFYTNFENNNPQIKVAWFKVFHFIKVDSAIFSVLKFLVGYKQIKTISTGLIKGQKIIHKFTLLSDL